MNNDQFSSSAPPDYLEKYSLSCAPFEADFQRKFFYAGTALMQRLDLLTHLTQFGEPLVAVSGPPGSGKTTLLSQFVAQANNRWYLCLLHHDAVGQLAAHLADALGGGDVSSGTDTLLDRWDTETDASQLFVILVDDADQLDADSCRTLCELLDKPQGERLRVLLFGTAALQPLLKETLAKLASARTPQILEVPRLSEEETAAYLMYRLAVAGYSGESPFSTTEIRGICKAADGWPGPINQLADETLRDHVMRARSKHGLPNRESISKKQLWMTGAGIAVISLAYLGWQALFPPEQETGTPREMQLAETETRLTLPAPLLQPDSPQQPAEHVARPTSEATPEDRLQEAPPTPPMEASEEPAPPLRDQVPLTEAVPLALPAAKQPLVSDASAPTTVAETDAPVSAEAQPSELADQQPPARSEPQPEESASIPPAEAPETPAAPAVSATPATTSPLPHREAWLLEQPDNQFSLQLLGSRSEQSLTAFIKQHKLDPAHTAYYRGLLKGSDWFVLMYGLYDSREAAMQGLASLPAAVRQGKPWPREMKTVHQSIREANP